MFKLRKLAVAALVSGSALVMSSVQAASDHTFIDFRGHGGHKSSYTFNQGDFSVQATGGGINFLNQLSTSSAQVGQWSHGLGVKSWLLDLNHTVDGGGWLRDVLFLNFSTPVVLESLFFGWTNGGNVTLLSGDLSQAIGTYALSSIGGGYYMVDLPDGLEGDSFALMAPGKKDAWKVAGVKVSHPTTAVIPSPAAGLAGMALLGLLATSRRRQS